MSELADVVVIGMGPGGEEVAGRLAEAGLDVVGIEPELVGGECPYWGCVPSKMMIRDANLLAEGRRIPGTAGSSSVSADWAPVAARIRDEATDDWNDLVAVKRFEGKGGRLIRGRGRLAGPETVTADGREFRARRAIVIATGSKNVAPSIPGLDSVPFWTNRDVMQLRELPRSLAILGGGSIGVEIGQALARFGVDVTVVEAADRILPAEDPEVGELIEQVLSEEGITVRKGNSVDRVSYSGGTYSLVTDDGSIEAERLLVATGRRPDLVDLGLDSISLDPSASCLATDPYLRAAPGVWAVGDVTGVGGFTHVAIFQARIAAKSILGLPTPPADYRALPRVTFTDPEVGTVGLTELAARNRGINLRVGATRVPSTARGFIHGVGNQGLIKVIEDADRGVLIGATTVGPAGGEVLGLLTLAVHAEIPVSQLRTMIYAYPTFHRGVEDALADLV